MGNGAYFAYSLINSLIARGKQKKIENQIVNENATNQGIIYYRPSPIEGFFDPNDAFGNMIISGGKSELRSRAMIAAAIIAYNQNIPVVFIHQSDNELEKQLAAAFSSTGALTIINDQNPIYEPLLGLSIHDMCRLLTNTAEKEKLMGQNAKYYLEGMINFLIKKGKIPYLKAFVNCPYSLLYNNIDSAVSRKVITQLDAQKIKAALIQGQSEMANVELFFNKLNQQMEKILVDKANIRNAVSIHSAVQKNGILAIDIMAGINSLLTNLLISQLQNEIRDGKKICVIFDEIATIGNESLSSFIIANLQKCKIVLSGNDVYSMLGSDEINFSSVIGNCSEYFLFSHGSGISCSKWAEAIGYYDKQEINPSYSIDNTSYNYSIKRDFIVKPEEIQRMKVNEAYIYDSINKVLSHAEIV